MWGSMSGSAILSVPKYSDALHTITVTVNNACNLACPHCYLQYKQDSAQVISKDTIRWLTESDCGHIAVVGKEPLANGKTVDSLIELVSTCKNAGKNVSIITNGLNTPRLPSYVIPLLSWVDISLDGSYHSYQHYREASLDKIRAGVSHLRANGCKSIRALNTISTLNVAEVEGMGELADFLGMDKCVFAPYFATRSHGVQTAGMVDPITYVEAFPIEAFKKLRPHMVVLIGDQYFRAFDMDAHTCRGKIASLKDSGMLKEINGDPIEKGLMRVTFDDKVLAPLDSLHTQDYYMRALPVEHYTSPDVTFQCLRNYKKQSFPSASTHRV